MEGLPGSGLINGLAKVRHPNSPVLYKGNSLRLSHFSVTLSLVLTQSNWARLDFRAGFLREPADSADADSAAPVRGAALD